MSRRGEGGRRKAEGVGGRIGRELTARWRLNFSLLARRSSIVPVFLVVILLSPRIARADPFTFDDIEFWIGEGANRAAMAVDWSHDSTDPPALVWGYRWDGAVKGLDMLTAVLAADARLFAKMGADAEYGKNVFGLGYDANDDVQFALEDESVFDEDGVTLSGPIYVPTSSTDPADLYEEGWFTPRYWLYGISTGNPYDGGSWSWSGDGVGTRTLSDGDWDSWTYAPVSSTTDFAENPSAAAAPYPLGDFNHDTAVDSADYALWKSEFGSTTAPDVDGNGNGVDDAADYTIWRDNFNTGSGQAATLSTSVPEPWTLGLAWCALWQLLIFQRKEKRS